MIEILTHRFGNAAQYLFDFEFYRENNQLDPCKHLTKRQIWNHYILLNGKARFFVPDIRTRDLNDRLKELPEDLSQCKLDIINYKRTNPDLAKLSDDELLEHFIEFGQFEIRKYKFCCPEIIIVNPCCPPEREKTCPYNPHSHIDNPGLELPTCQPYDPCCNPCKYIKPPCTTSCPDNKIYVPLRDEPIHKASGQWLSEYLESKHYPLMDEYYKCYGPPPQKCRLPYLSNCYDCYTDRHGNYQYCPRGPRPSLKRPCLPKEWSCMNGRVTFTNHDTLIHHKNYSTH